MPDLTVKVILIMHIHGRKVPIKPIEIKGVSGIQWMVQGILGYQGSLLGGHGNLG